MAGTAARARKMALAAARILLISGICIAPGSFRGRFCPLLVGRQAGRGSMIGSVLVRGNAPPD
jgi:hypothetical protein